MPSRNVINLGIPSDLYNAYRRITRITGLPTRGLITKALQEFLPRCIVTPRGTLQIRSSCEPCPPMPLPAMPEPEPEAIASQGVAFQPPVCFHDFAGNPPTLPR
jgi:hypothetical protein